MAFTLDLDFGGLTLLLRWGSERSMTLLMPDDKTMNHAPDHVRVMLVFDAEGGVIPLPLDGKFYSICASTDETFAPPPELLPLAQLLGTTVDPSYHGPKAIADNGARVELPMLGAVTPVATADAIVHARKGNAPPTDVTRRVASYFRTRVRIEDTHLVIHDGTTGEPVRTVAPSAQGEVRIGIYHVTPADLYHLIGGPKPHRPHWNQAHTHYLLPFFGKHVDADVLSVKPVDKGADPALCVGGCSC